MDDVKLDVEGWKDRYYRSKLENAVTPVELARQYLIGVAWVMKYYYEVIIPYFSTIRVQYCLNFNSVRELITC